MNYKLKNSIFIAGFFLSLIVVYQLAIKKTIEAKNTNATLVKEKIEFNNISGKIAKLKFEETRLDSLLSSSNLSINSSFQQTLLQKITSFSRSRRLEVVSFDEPHQFSVKDLKMATYTFEIKGDFISLLQLVNYLEQQQLGALISIAFTKKENYKNNRKYLVATIMLRKIKS